MQNYDFSWTLQRAEVAGQPTSLESKERLESPRKDKHGLTCTRAWRKMGPNVLVVKKSLAKIMNKLLKAKYELSIESLEPVGTTDTREVCIYSQSLLHE